MSGRLSREELKALKFAARRQISRWGERVELSPPQHSQRAALQRALRTLDERAFTNGCELRAPSDE